jgi:hypothetical protein
MLKVAMAAYGAQRVALEQRIPRPRTILCRCPDVSLWLCCGEHSIRSDVNVRLIAKPSRRFFVRNDADWFTIEAA